MAWVTALLVILVNNPLKPEAIEVLRLENIPKTALLIGTRVSGGNENLRDSIKEK
jgi:hypothetical protein